MLPRRDPVAICAAPVPVDGVCIDERANRRPLAVHDSAQSRRPTPCGASIAFQPDRLPRHPRRDPVAAVGNLPTITGETIDADAATSPAERTDAPTDGRDADGRGNTPTDFQGGLHGIDGRRPRNRRREYVKTLDFLLVTKFP